jgi:hypothetical protein
MKRGRPLLFSSPNTPAWVVSTSRPRNVMLLRPPSTQALKVPRAPTGTSVLTVRSWYSGVPTTSKPTALTAENTE